LIPSTLKKTCFMVSGITQFVEVCKCYFWAIPNAGNKGRNRPLRFYVASLRQPAFAQNRRGCKRGASRRRHTHAKFNTTFLFHKRHDCTRQHILEHVARPLSGRLSRQRPRRSRHNDALGRKYFVALAENRKGVKPCAKKLKTLFTCRLTT